jgi:methylated-DNA-[protein]-cysteine S-methyltransferase
MTNTLRSTTIPTPVGPFRVIASHNGIHAAGFTPDRDPLLALLTPAERERPIPEVDDLRAVSAALAAYFDGDLAAIDALPVVQAAAPFTAAAREAMRAIPAGRVLTYRELASAAGRPDAPRAAGAACAGNRVALVVPCHRVVRTDGSLGGYLWGLDVKRWLLAHEATMPALTAPSFAGNSQESYIPG